MPDSGSAIRQRLHGYCALCKSRCGCISVVENGRLVAVEPDPDHPTGAHLCAKGRAAPEIVHAPERLTMPLIRTAPKDAADPGWREAPWDEALDLIAARMKRTAETAGPEALAFAITTPSGTAMSDHIDWVERFVRAYGACNTIYATELCNWHKDHAPVFTFGTGIGVPDFEHTDYLVLWGHNPNTAWLAHGTRAAQAKARGAKLLVIDPRRVGLAVKADLWLQPRPGTDGALALGIAERVIARQGFDLDFVKRWSNAPFLVRDDDGRFLRARDVGDTDAPESFVVWREDTGRTAPVPRDGATAWPDAAVEGRFEIETAQGPVHCRPAFALYQELCAAYAPDRVAALTGVPAEAIDRAAALIAESESVSFYAWTGLGQHANATQTARAVTLLYALTGSYDAPGGNRFLSGVPTNDVSGRDLLAPSQAAKTIGRQQRPLGPAAGGWVTGADFCQAIESGEPYRIEGLFAFGSNLLLSQPDSRRMRRALEAVPFHVQTDLFMTPTAALADVVLPVSSPWEHEALRLGFDRPMPGAEGLEELVQLRQPAVAPPGEARSDSWIVFALAKRLGLGAQFFDGDQEAGLRHRLAPSGLTPEALRAKPQGIRIAVSPSERTYAQRGESATAFATETGRVEIYSELLLRHGYDPLPDFAPSVPDDDPAGYPLLLTCAKLPQFCHSQHRGIARLRRVQPEPRLDLHPRTAERFGIAEADWVRVRTPDGAFEARARLSEGQREDTVCGQFGWWQGCEALGLPGSAPDREPTVNFNLAMDGRRADPISGAPPLRSSRCRVEPAIR